MSQTPQPVKQRIAAAAQRALAEAETRKAAEQAANKTGAAAQGQPAEHNGPRGAEPTRFGDWERKGIAVDF